MTQNTPPPVFSWTSRQVIIATLFVVSVILAFWLLYRFSTAILILFVAVVIGTALKPAVEWLAHRGLTRLQGQALIYLVVLLAVTGFLLLVLPLVLEQATAISAQLGGYYQEVRNFLLRSPSNMLQRLGFGLPFNLEVESLVQQPETPATPEEALSSVDQVARLFTFAGLASRGVFSIIAVLLMAFYWTLEGDRALRSLMLFVPSAQRENLRSLIESIEQRVGGFLLGQGVLMLMVGSMALVAYLLIGLPNALVLALIAGLMEAVPVIGPGLGAVPAILVAFSVDPTKIIWVVLATVIIQALENSILMPRVMGESVGVNPLLTLLAFAAFSSLLGLVGALLAVPAAAVVQILINRFVLEPAESSPVEPEGRDHLSYLRYQAQEIAQDTRKHLRHKEDEEDGEDGEEPDLIEDELEALANDLDRVLAQAANSGSTAENHGS